MRDPNIDIESDSDGTGKAISGPFPRPRGNACTASKFDGSVRSIAVAVVVAIVIKALRRPLRRYASRPTPEIPSGEGRSSPIPWPTSTRPGQVGKVVEPATWGRASA
ncbi:unnamed protein product, partial [Iphiclides podalirius]